MEATETRPKRVCSPKYAVQKARKGKTLNRWEIEELAKDAEQSYLYATKVLKGRFPEGERAIMESRFVFDYAKVVIKGRWEEAEPKMLRWLKSDNYLERSRSHDYFILTACVPNKKFERHILKERPDSLVDYARNCLKGRWAEAEKKILEGNDDSEYHRDVVKDRWPELEDKIFFKKLRWQEDRKDMLLDYLKVVPEPGPEFEAKLEKCNRGKLLLTYATKYLEGRLPPALHQRMLMFSFDPKKKGSARKYIKYLAYCEKRALKYLSDLDGDELEKLVGRARSREKVGA